MKDRLFELVKKIPYGRVSTYGILAEKLGNKNLCRVVGNILHTNKDYMQVPCYRVVNRCGRLSNNYGIGGLDKQKDLLINEGVNIVNNKVDNLEKYIYKF